MESRGPAGVEELLAEARDRAAALRREPPRPGLRARAGGARGRHARARRDLRPGQPGRPLRDAQLHARHRRPGPRRADAADARAGAAIETQLLFFELEWNQLPDEQAAELLEADGLDFCRHHLRNLRRYRPHQLSEPEERVMTELDVTGSSAFRRLYTEQLSAIEADLPDEEGPTPLEIALSRLQQPDRAAARAGGPRRHRGAAPRPAHARVHVQHARGGQGDQGPPARLPALAGVAQPLQRGQRRVGRGAGRRRRRALRAGPALVPAQGPAARPRPARALGPHGAAERQHPADPLRRGARDRARLLLELLARARRGRRGLLRQRLHRRPAAAGQARRRVLRLHRAVAAPVRDAQLHVAPLRRARDGARARATACTPRWRAPRGSSSSPPR